MRRSFMAAAIVIAEVGLSTFGASPTEAAVFAVGPPSDGFASAGTCMDVFRNNPAARTQVIAFDCHAGPNQQFQFIGSGVSSLTCPTCQNIYTMAGQRCLQMTPSQTGGPPIATSEDCQPNLPAQSFRYQGGRIITVGITAGMFCLAMVQIDSPLVFTPCIAGDPNQQWQIK